MAQPDVRDVHIDAVLSNLSVAFAQNPNNYIAAKVFPVVPVAKQTDKYYVWDRGSFLTDSVRRRGPATESAGSGYSLSTASYDATVWALHKDIPDQLRANSDDQIDPDRNATQFLTQQMLNRQEIDWVSTYFNTGLWETDVVGGTDFTQWDDFAGSDPVEDVEEAKELMLASTGIAPNTLVLGYRVFRKLKNHPDILDRYKYTTAQQPTEAILANLFDVDRILVARAIKNTAVEGETTTYGFVHGNSALLCYAAPRPALEVPSAGYTFMWSGLMGGTGLTSEIRKFRIEPKRVDRVEIEAAWDNAIVAPELGYFFQNAVAA
jgi:hypothetical protein